VPSGRPARRGRLCTAGVRSKRSASPTMPRRTTTSGRWRPSGAP